MMVVNLEDRIKFNGVGLITGIARKVSNYLVENVKEKVELVTNPKKFYNEMIELGKREGLPFMCYAIAVEVVEDVVVPIVLANTNNSEYIPIVLAGHSEPVMYPLYFGVRKLYRKLTNYEAQVDEDIQEIF